MACKMFKRIVVAKDIQSWRESSSYSVRSIDIEHMYEMRRFANRILSSSNYLSEYSKRSVVRSEVTRLASVRLGAKRRL